MENLTGIRDIDKLILLNLDDKSLSQAALVSTYVNSLMDELFWGSKFYHKYGVTLWKYNVSHKSIYKEFSILKDEELSKRVIDYNFIELIKPLVKDSNKIDLAAYAVEGGHLEVIKLLLNMGVGIYDQDCYYANLLILAVDNGHLDIVKLLIERDYYCAYVDDTLEIAASNGYLEIVELLLIKGVDIHSNSEAALQSASQNGHLEIVNLLLNKGANIAYDSRALEWVASNGHLEVVKLLLNRGADIHTNNDGALRHAAYYGHLKVVELLLDCGADIHAYRDEALQWAAQNGHLKVVELLLNRGVHRRCPTEVPRGVHRCCNDD